MNWFTRWRWRVWSARVKAMEAAVDTLHEHKRRASSIATMDAIDLLAAARRAEAYWRTRMQAVLPRADAVKLMRPAVAIYCPGYNAAFYDDCPHACVGSFCKRATSGRGRQIHDRGRA